MKKFLLMVLCAAMVISCVACTSQSGGTGNVGGITSSPENTGAPLTPTPTQPGEPMVIVTDRTNSYIYDSYIYDKSGRITEIRTFNTRVSQTQPNSKALYTYHEQSDGSVIVKIVREYLELSKYDCKELVFNADGICIECRTYETCSNRDEGFLEQNLSNVKRYEYDSSKNLTKSYYTNTNKYIVYGYDANGNMTSYQKWENDVCYKSAEYIRNDNGDIAKETVKKPSESDQVSEYTNSYKYDGAVLLKKSTLDERKACVAETTYTYDQSGAVTKIEIVSKHDGLTSMSYFAGNGYLAEWICFPMTGNTITLMPLSQALVMQNQ